MCTSRGSDAAYPILQDTCQTYDLSRASCEDAVVLLGDARQVLGTLSEKSVHCCVTSPPYFGLRDYGVDGQMGLESSPDAYIAEMVSVFRAVRRVLRDDGTVWLNLGDTFAANRSYQVRDNKHTEVGNTLPMRVPAGMKEKDLMMLPHRVAIALQDDGWWVRADIVWHKPNPMPESVRDRPTRAHEYIFLLSKSARYYYDAGAIVEERTSTTNVAGPNSRANRDHVPRTNLKQDMIGKGTYTGFNERWSNRETTHRNKRDVWTVATAPYAEAHFATFPPKLIEPCILAGCPPDGVVLDPFAGSGTTGMVAVQHGRRFVGIEINPEYLPLIESRLQTVQRALPLKSA